MELRLTTIVVAFAFIGVVTCVPTRHSNQQYSHQNQQITGSSSESDIIRLLKSIDEQVKDDVSKDTARHFTELVERLSQLEHNVISSIDRQVRSKGTFSSRKLEDIWNDALIMNASEGSLKLITQQILDSSVSSARKNYLLSMMAFIQSPSAGAVRAVLPLLEAKQVQRQTILSVSALIANARRNNSLPEKELQDAVTAIVKYLKQHESSPDKVTVALKALHNLHFANDDVALVSKFAADGKQSKSVRLAALEALTDHAADDFVVKKVEKIYNDASETAEIRIAAYKVLVSHADSKVVSRIVSSLDREANKQVGAFVTSHLANLKETAAPRHQQIRHVLADVSIPTERFPSDLRKYSRNVELSQQTLGLGAVVDGDLIYDQSIAPRSVRLNLSLPLYHREINLVELSLRQEGLESEMEKLLSPNGPFAGKNMKQIISDTMEYLQSADMSNRIQYRKSIARTSSSNDLEFSMALKLDGNTVAYFDIADFTSSQNDMQMIFNKLKEQMSSNWAQDRAFAFKFGRTFEIPSEHGSKSISVNGSAVFGLKVDKSGLWPSMSMELSTRTPEKHIIQRVHSSPSLKFVIEGHKITLKFADKQMNIVSISNEAFDIDSQGHETAIVVPQRSFEHCSNYLNKVLGMQVCAKFSGPKSLWSDKAPCYAQWTMDVSLMKVDSKMTGWQFGFENKEQNTYRVTFDTPRSSIKRNVAFEFELLEKLTGIRGKIELPRRSMEMYAGYSFTRDEIFGKFEVKSNENDKYSLTAGFKEKKIASQKTELTPLLRIEVPRSQPITLTGSVVLDTKSKWSMVVDLHNDMQGAQRKSIKGGVTYAGSLLKDLKLSANLQAQIDSITMRLFSTADKKEDGSAQTDVKVEYQLPNSRVHTAEFIGKIQNLDVSGASLKMNSFVELKMTQFPEKNVHISWNIQHRPREHLENELTIMWKDQMNDPKRKIHLLHIVELTGIKTKALTATCKNLFHIDIAPLNIKYETKVFGSLQRSGSPNHKLSVEFHDKVSKDNFAASWEYQHLSSSPLKMAIDASVRVNDRLYKYSDQIQEIAPRTFKGITELQWAKDKKANLNYVFKRITERPDEIYQLEGEVKLPSFRLIQHSGVMILSPRGMRFDHKLQHGSDKVWDVSGRFSGDEQSEIKFIFSDVEGKMSVSPYTAEKTAHLSFKGKSINHITDINRSGDSFVINSKTTDGKKTVAAVNCKLMTRRMFNGPHDIEVRFAPASGKSGERKIKIHHENGKKLESTVTYYVKNLEQGKFEIHSHHKSLENSRNQLVAGMSLKTAAKYHNYDGFKVEWTLDQQHIPRQLSRLSSVLSGELTEEQKIRLAIEGELSGHASDVRLFSKVVVDTPVFDFKHQEATIEYKESKKGSEISVNALTNENKNLRLKSEMRSESGDISKDFTVRALAQSDIHNAKYEADLKYLQNSANLTIKSNDKVILHTDGSVGYNGPRDMIVSLNGNVMSSPSYKAVFRAVPNNKKTLYNVVARVDGKEYATGDMRLDISRGCNVYLKMKLAEDDTIFIYDQETSRNIISGPHKFAVSIQGRRLTKRVAQLTHSIVDNKLSQSVSYDVVDRPIFKLNNDIFYLIKRESGAEKHTGNMDIVMQIERETYKVKHEGSVKIQRDAVEFNSNAQWQDKKVWSAEGRFGKSGKQTIEMMILDHSGKMECTPYADTVIAKVEIKSSRYFHATNMELIKKQRSFKLDSKATVRDTQLYTLDITFAPRKPNSLAFESKWFNLKMNADLSKSPATGSFSALTKNNAKVELKGQLTMDETDITISAAGNCASCKKYDGLMKAQLKSNDGHFDVKIDEENREKFSVSGSFDKAQGFRGTLTCKKEGNEFVAARVNMNSRFANGPNDIEITFNSIESIKLRHEKINGKRHTITLEHLRGGARKNFAQVYGEMEMTPSIVDAKFSFDCELEKRFGKVKTMNVVLTHRHEIVKSRKFAFSSRAEAKINNSPFVGEIRWELEPKSLVNLELSSESPIHKFEKQSFSIQGKWKKEFVSVVSKLDSSAGCNFRFNGKVAVDAKRAMSVTGDMTLETPKKNFSRQEATLSASWDESRAQFKLTGKDAKKRKLDLSGESEISADRIYARGQCESDFPFIKSSFVEVKGGPESANVMVKYNDQEILKADAKNKWENKEKFDITVEGKARSSPMFTLNINANKVANVLKYTVNGKRDDKAVALLEVTSDVSEGYKFTADASLPTIKVKGSMKSEFSAQPAHGPHQLDVSFESEKLGAHALSLTHKIQNERVKCTLDYTQNGKVRFDLQHSGLYRWNREQGKLSMDAEFDCKVDSRSFSIHHAGDVEIKRRDFIMISSKAEYNRKSLWQTTCKLSKRDESYVHVYAAQREANLKVNPFGTDKIVLFDYKSPLYTHETDGRLNVKSWDALLRVKSLKNTQKLIDFSAERRANGPSRMSLESIWAEGNAEYDVSKRPMTAHMFLKTKKMSPRTEMKVQGTLSDADVQLDGEFKLKNSYKGSLRAVQEPESMYVEVKSQKNDKPYYNGRVNAAMRSNGIKADAKWSRKDVSLAQVTVALSNQIVDGPHSIEITLPGNQEEKMSIRHEIIAGKWTASAIHMAKGEKRGFLELTGKATGKLSNADVSFTLNGESKKKIMHLTSLSVAFNHRHSITKNTLDVTSTMKSFINRKDNLFGKAVIEIDTRSKAAIDMLLQTPFIDFKNQELAIESKWDRESANLNGKLTASSGKTVVITGQSSSKSGKVEMKGEVESEIASIPSIKLNGSVDSEGFGLIVEKNGEKALELSGKAKVDFGKSKNVEATLEGIYNRGPVYTASVSGKSNEKGGFFKLNTYRNKRDLMGAYASSKINSPEDWDTSLHLDSQGSRMATFDLMKGQCANGHPTYIAAYSVRDMAPRMSVFHEADVAPLLRTIRSIRGI